MPMKEIRMKQLKKERSVTLMSRAKIAGKWVRKKAIYGKSGRVVPGLILHQEQELRLSDVSYDLRYYEGGKPVYLPAGKNASDAEAQRRRLVERLTAKDMAEAAGLQVVLEPDRKTLKEWARDYVSKRSIELGKDQLQRIKYVQGLFFESCKKTYLDELTEGDMEAFMQHLARLPLLRNRRSNLSKRRNAAQRRVRCPVSPGKISARTVFNYYTAACKWLKKGGVDPRIFPPAPKFEEPEVTVYTPEQLKALFALVKGSLRLALSLMLKCGLRRREVSYAYFADINFGDKTILVRGKPEWGFVVKNRIQRYVPVPDDLLEELRRWAAEHPGQLLIVPNARGKPDLALIKSLKRFVYLHGLRCGRCAHCRSGNPECEEWELHKFRRSYATALVRHVDLRTAQRYLGHKRIASTERYLKAASAAEGQKKVSGIDFTENFYS